MLTPDTLLHSRYRVVRQIGQGGMGAVYEAVDERLRTPVALKQTTVAGAELSRAFEHEAQLLAGLRHPALPRVIDHFIDAAGQFLVMEFIPGDDLAGMLKARGAAFPPDQVLAWADQLLDALEYLHGQQPPVIHRDIKPQNLKLTGRGEMILLDFGLAKGRAALATAVEGAGASVFGYTPQYAPLEQVHGSGTDARSDLYSLAATLYHLLSGQAPADTLSRANAALNGKPDPLQPANALRPEVTPTVAGALAQAMALRADQRFISATAMRRALREAAAELPAATTGPTVVARQAQTAPPVPARVAESYDDLSQPAPTPPARRGGPRLLALLLVVVVLLIGSFAATWLLASMSGGGQATTATAPPAPAESRAPTEAAAATELPAPTAAAAPAELPVQTVAVAAALDPGLPPATATPLPPPPALNITNNPGRSSDPVAAVDRQGTLHVLWEDTTPRQGKGADLLARSRSADGAWSDVTILSEGFDFFMGNQLLMRRADGSICALWYGARVNPSDIGVYMSCYELEGWGKPERRDDVVYGGNRREYHVVSTPDGQLAYITIVSAGDLLFGKEFELSDGFKLAYRPDMAMTPDGSLHVIWTRMSDPATLTYRRSNDHGQTWSDPISLSVPDSAPGGVHSIIADASGAVHVAWVSSGIWYRRLPAGGDWSEPMEVTQGEDRSMAVNIGLAVGADGLARIAWQGQGTNYVQQGEDGSWSYPRVVAEEPAGSGPAMATDDQGQTYVVWEVKDDALDLYYATLEP